jgi:hypothetical protein
VAFGLRRNLLIVEVDHLFRFWWRRPGWLIGPPLAPGFPFKVPRDHILFSFSFSPPPSAARWFICLFSHSLSLSGSLSMPSRISRPPGSCSLLPCPCFLPPSPSFLGFPFPPPFLSCAECSASFCPEGPPALPLLSLLFRLLPPRGGSCLGSALRAPANVVLSFNLGEVGSDRCLAPFITFPGLGASLFSLLGCLWFSAFFPCFPLLLFFSFLFFLIFF